MQDKARADRFSLADIAILACGCRGPMLSCDEDGVQFGVAQRGCDHHEKGDIISVLRGELLSPANPTEFWKIG